jgi:phosphoribosylaminoimidazolecarboxamide formyltransferase/IMP cyclohydrolase
MSIRENIYQVVELIKPSHILVSVFDKSGLDDLVKGILDVNRDARFYSTGGTGKKIMEILGTDASRNYTSVEDFTGAPEMEGGLVKTLHPKIHAGLLAERGNPAHEEYLYKTLAKMGGTPGVYFDVFVGNLYPFSSVIAKEDTTSETARVNIDIGGPAMTMASAKNWHSVAALTASAQYRDFISALKSIGDYRTAIGNYFSSLDFQKDVMPYVSVR